MKKLLFVIALVSASCGDVATDATVPADSVTKTESALIGGQCNIPNLKKQLCVSNPNWAQCWVEYNIGFVVRDPVPGPNYSPCWFALAPWWYVQCNGLTPC